jgi:hypothetical protein
MKTIRFFALVGTCSLIGSLPARADSDIIVPYVASDPMIQAFGGNVTAGSDIITASSQTVEYDNTGAANQFTAGSGERTWQLNATINTSGTLAAGGTLAFYGGGAEPLLSGNLNGGNIGASWSGAGGGYQSPYTKNKSGGTLASDFLASANDIGFSSGDASLGAVWDYSFGGDVVNTPTFVPEPSCYPVCAFAVLGLGAIVRRNRPAREHNACNESRG